MWNLSLGRTKIPPQQALEAPSNASRAEHQSSKSHQGPHPLSPISNNGLDGAGNGGQDFVQDLLLSQPCQTHH